MITKDKKQWIIGISVFVIFAAGASAIAVWQNNDVRYRPETAGQGYGGQGAAVRVAEGEVYGSGRLGGGRGAGTQESGNAGAGVGYSDTGNDQFFMEMEALFDSAPTQSLSAAEIEALEYMWNEEKLARDVYAALADSWNMNVFANISSSEDQHMDSVAFILQRYDVDVPGSDTFGSFSSPEFLSLYNELVEQGRQSLLAAYEVGATIEDLDIYDLQERLEETENSEVAVLYQNLMKGSRNHIRSFIRLIERQGESYEAQFITEDYLESILSFNTETAVITTPEYHF